MASLSSQTYKPVDLTDKGQKVAIKTPPRILDFFLHANPL